MSDIGERLRKKLEAIPKRNPLTEKELEEIREEEKKELDLERITYVKRLRQKALANLQIVEKLLELVKEGEPDTKQINAVLSANNRNYLFTKEVAAFLKDGVRRGTPEYDAVDILGNPGDFPASLSRSEDGIYCFHLPQLESKKTTDTGAGDKNPMRYLVLYLIREYEKENHVITPFKKPLLVFEHIFDKDKSLRHVPDFDNMDTKAVIDALEYYMIENDSALDITLVHIGKIGDETYTNLYVSEEEMMLRIWAKIASQSEENDI